MQTVDSGEYRREYRVHRPQRVWGIESIQTGPRRVQTIVQSTQTVESMGPREYVDSGLQRVQTRVHRPQRVWGVESMQTMDYESIDESTEYTEPQRVCRLWTMESTDQSTEYTDCGEYVDCTQTVESIECRQYRDQNVYTRVCR